MITVKEARERLPERYNELPDNKIQEILDFFYKVAHLMVENNYKQS